MDIDSVFKDSVRIADEEIYLTEDRRNNPKEVFIQIADFIKSYDLPEDFSICDVGCATGEFLYYVMTQFPHCKLTGFDISSALTTAAQKTLPGAQFINGSINDEACLLSRRFDIITFLGSMACLDNPKPALLNLLVAIKKGGRIIIQDAYNADPIDTLMRYRRADREDAPWESGWNIFSCYTIEKIFRESGYAIDFEWHDMVMPFAIEHRDDPMRAWTTQLGTEPHFRINGAGQLLDVKAVQVLVKDVP